MTWDWPKCKECGYKLSMGKLDETKFFCKQCNEMYDSEDILNSNETVNKDNKSISII